MSTVKLNLSIDEVTTTVTHETENKQCDVCYVKSNAENHITMMCNHSVCKGCYLKLYKKDDKSGSSLTISCPFCRVRYRINQCEVYEKADERNVSYDTNEYTMIFTVGSVFYDEGIIGDYIIYDTNDPGYIEKIVFQNNKITGYYRINKGNLNHSKKEVSELKKFRLNDYVEYIKEYMEIYKDNMATNGYKLLTESILFFYKSCPAHIELIKTIIPVAEKCKCCSGEGQHHNDYNFDDESDIGSGSESDSEDDI